MGDYEPSLPVSEKSNPLTCDIDRASAESIVKMLHRCDVQMFQEESEGTYQRLLSDQVVKTLAEVAKRAELILKDPQDSLVVLSGCGTSGRLAFLIAARFNRALRQLKQNPVYSYIIAGGDRALLSSQEAPEDDPKLGMLSLKKVCEGKKRVLFVGISCGLSAPFVAGQLDFCLQHPEVYTPVLIGFNPAHQARDEAMPGCTFTFHSVVQRMQEHANAFLINPAVGPEAISGSSRMKGGSATKILLEVVLSAAQAAAFSRTPVTCNGIVQHIGAHKRTVDVTYSECEGIAALVEAAGRSLQGGGCVCYLGWGSLAVLSLMDASECNPTFGADYEDVRGFISGGYAELNINEGSLTSLGPDFCIAHEDFLHLLLPRLTDKDTVLLIYTHCDDVGDVLKLARRVREKMVNLHAFYHQADGDTSAALQQVSIHQSLFLYIYVSIYRSVYVFFLLQDDINKLCLSTLNITWPAAAMPFCRQNRTLSSVSVPQQWELSTKLVLNAVSTGAHILKGKIYQNHMIDVQVTNSKLYRRATRLLQRLSGRPGPQCEEALLKAIYQVEELTGDIPSCDITTHTHKARSRTKVVPAALVCLLTGCSLVEAESHLKQRPIIREAVEELL
ncbi:glucokinase regulatory protein isoform X2 [Parambassis ranga]|uniref:Glucokinase regulatory protein isoform X2 n=1 Tax=Parambassis ranga TaxID=210632 RepID=A0A6P7HUZ7_9TELE|nr:glucokinase regulatory protein isoform X2 [Parambassis ranga]